MYIYILLYIYVCDYGRVSLPIVLYINSKNFFKTYISHTTQQKAFLLNFKITKKNTGHLKDLCLHPTDLI